MNAKMILSKFTVLTSSLSNVGALALCAMMVLTVTDVAGRYLFNAPLLGAFELTEFLVLILIFSFLAYTQANKRHVAVEILINRFPKKIQLMADLINHVICLGLLLLITCMAIAKGFDLIETRETSPNLVISNYPFVFFLALGSLVLCIEYAKDIIGLLTKDKENSR